MEIKKLDLKMENSTKDSIEKLKELFPEIVVEGKIDLELLKEQLGEEINKETEKYMFTWTGKNKAKQIAKEGSSSTLRPDCNKIKDLEKIKNIYIEGENLEVLKVLKKSYYQKIKMIYIDPPYNTGKDFIYKDNFKEKTKSYLEKTGQLGKEGQRLSTNLETDGSFHSNWLNMMYSRLWIARTLLREDGVIFISIDDNEFANLKKLCDEIFGEKNYLGDIIWNSTKSVTNTALISVSHTYTLVYFKSKDYFIENRQEFRLPDNGEGFENPDNDPKGPWKADPFQVGGWRPNQQYEIVNPKTGVVYRPNPNCSWKNDYEKYKELVAENRIIFGKTGDGGPLRKRYIWEAAERGKVAKTIWDDVETTTNGTQTLKNLFNNISLFDNPKSVGFIKRLLQLGTSSDSIVLDFFSGSATTAHAVMQLNAEDGGNRKYILVQFPEECEEKSEAYKAGYKNICEIGKERIRKAGEKIKADESLALENREKLDIEFKVFKLDSSNIKEWDSETDNLKQMLLDSVDNVKLDRNSLDILYEILLKYGLDLNVSIEEKNNFYSVGGGTLLINLDKEINMNTIDSICKEYKNLLEIDKGFKATVVLRDSAFKNDIDKTNAMKKLEQIGIKEVRSI